MTDPIVLDHVLIGIMVAIVLYAVLRGQRSLRDMTFDTATKLSLYWSNAAMLWIGAIATGAVWLFAGRPLVDLGLTWRHAAPGITALITVAFVLKFAYDSWRELASEARREKLREHWRRDVPFLPQTPRECVHFSFLSLTAGVTEEVMFRGYVISYLSALLGPSVVAAIAAVTLSAAVFALVHGYQGWKDGLRIFLMAAVAGAIFVVSGSLLIPIVLHFLIDLGAGLLALRLIGPPAVDADRQLTEPS